MVTPQPTLRKSSKILSRKQPQNLYLDVISFCTDCNERKRHWPKFSLKTGPLTPSPFPCLSLKSPSFWIHFNEQPIETASRGSKQSRDSHFDLFPMEKRAPCLARKMFGWLTVALMCKLLWTSDIKFPSGCTHFYSPSTGFTSRRSASGGDKINLQKLWILHQNSAQVSPNWILFGLNLQCKSASFVQFQFRGKWGSCI